MESAETIKTIKTVGEVLMEDGIFCGDGRLDESYLQIRFSPTPNWYVSITAFKCPRCETMIRWHWNGETPNITTPQSIRESAVSPIADAGVIEGWGHRYIIIRCPNPDCKQLWFANNFDA